MTELTIPLRSHDEAVLVLGPYDRYAKMLRQELDIEIYTRRGNIRLNGPSEGIAEAQRRIEHLLGKARKGRELNLADIEKILLGNSTASTNGPQARSHERGQAGLPVPDAPPDGAPTKLRPRRRGRGRAVEARNASQRRYLEQMAKSDLVVAVGPAGTGKTYLAVAAAVQSLRSGGSRRIIITRPVVEAGERLGFLPGDLQEKLDPYMRPVYDAFYDLLDHDEVARLEETGIIEVAPLAYMRGRTLSHAFVILDEGQNTTIAQMKMFLTRLGEGSRMVVTGDPSQNDLPQGERSGLNDAVIRLRGYQDIAVVEFSPKDIVRHPLVEQIVRAYQAPTRSEKGERADRPDRSETV